MSEVFSADGATPQPVIPAFIAAAASSANIYIASTGQIAAGMGVLYSVTVNSPKSDSYLTLFDGTGPTGRRLAKVDTSHPGAFTYGPNGIVFTQGLYAEGTGNADMTIVFAAL